MVIQFLEYLVYNVLVLGYVVVFSFFWSSCGVDCHIVHVNCHAPICYKVSEYCVHHGLEGSWRVSKPKKHDRQFEQSFIGHEHYLSLVSVFDSNVVVAPLDIKFCKQGAPLQLVD